MLDNEPHPPPTLRVQRVGGPIGHPDHEGFTVLDDDYCEVAPIASYLDHLTSLGHSPYTVRNYAYALRVYFAYLGRRQIAWDDPTNALTTLGQFVGWLRRGDGQVVSLHQSEARCHRTINAYITAIYGLYKFHQRHGVRVLENLIADDQRSHYKSFLTGLVSGSSPRRLISLTEPKARVADLPMHQALAVIEAQAHLRDRLLFMVLLHTGMRIGQALGLRHQDIDLETGYINIVARSDNLNGARAKSVTDGEGALLGRVLMTETLIECYVEYIQEEAAHIGSDYVFVNLRAGRIGAPMTYSNVNDLVRRTRKKVGFRFTPHQFRHTFATQARDRGVPMENLKEMLTHKSVATTIDIYAHVSPASIREHLVTGGLLEPHSAPEATGEGSQA